MNIIPSRWIILGSLCALFVVTHFYSQEPTPSNLAAGISLVESKEQVTQKAEVTREMSPKPLVTELVVTNVTHLSPSMSPVTSNTPAQPSPVHTIVKTPTPSDTPLPALSPSVTLLAPTPTASSPAVATIKPVVVNEIAWMGTTSSANDEWIELYNPDNQAVHLEGWTLMARDGTPKIILTGTIGPQGHHLLKRTSESVIADVPANQIYVGALGNAGEVLELRDSAGTLVDTVDGAAGWPAGDNPAGNSADRASMERVNSSVSGTSGSNWKSNVKSLRNGHDSGGNLVNGTPGKLNSTGAF